MAPPLGSQLLYAIGGGVSQKHGTLVWRKTPPTGGGEIPYTHTRADVSTCASYVDYDNLVRTAAANTPRVEWVDLDGDGVRETPGILLEGSRATMLDNSSMEADNNGWLTVAGATNTRDNAHAIHGSWAEKIVIPLNTINSGAAALLRSGLKVPVTVGQPYSGSGWVYADPGSAAVGKLFKLSQQWFDGGGAFLSSVAITQVLVAGWQRLFVNGAVAPANAVTTHLLFCSGAGTDPTYTVWVDLPQIENALFASSAIPTGSGVLTRAADAFTVPVNFGPLDCTVLARLARPVWADVAGDIGFTPGIWDLGGTGLPQIRGGGVQAARQYFGYVDTATTDSNASQSILAGAQQTIVWQFKNLLTAGQVAVDAGGGLGSFASAAAPLSAYGSQTLRIGGLAGGLELYGVLLDLIVARGLFSLTDMLGVAL